MITELKENQIFVFGSNLAGIHGKGAALTARMKFFAQEGRGIGRTGQCFAIPTKDRNLKTLPLDIIGDYVSYFLVYAITHPKLEFLVTPIGCGLAGYNPEQIAPMFTDLPSNVILPQEFANLQRD